MPPRVVTLLRFLERNPMMVYRLGDLTGYPLTEIESLLEYLEGFGIVEHHQGYWIRPDVLANEINATSYDHYY